MRVLSLLWSVAAGAVICTSSLSGSPLPRVDEAAIDLVAERMKQVVYGRERAPDVLPADRTKALRKLMASGLPVPEAPCPELYPASFRDLAQMAWLQLHWRDRQVVLAELTRERSAAARGRLNTALAGSQTSRSVAALTVRLPEFSASATGHAAPILPGEVRTSPPQEKGDKVESKTSPVDSKASAKEVVQAIGTAAESKQSASAPAPASGAPIQAGVVRIKVRGGGKKAGSDIDAAAFREPPVQYAPEGGGTQGSIEPTKDIAGAIQTSLSVGPNDLLGKYQDWEGDLFSGSFKDASVSQSVGGFTRMFQGLFDPALLKIKLPGTP